jgi:hypothetical protein
VLLICTALLLADTLMKTVNNVWLKTRLISQSVQTPVLLQQTSNQLQLSYLQNHLMTLFLQINSINSATGFNQTVFSWSLSPLEIEKAGCLGLLLVNEMVVFDLLH